MEGARTSCDGRAIVVGHSFVTRLGMMVGSGEKRYEVTMTNFGDFRGPRYRE